MTQEATGEGTVLNLEKLPAQFPTHRHDPAFWESLGRAVATFGFLEEVLTKAIFSFTATKPYKPSEIDKAFEEWLPTLEKALSDTLGALITKYKKAVEDHPDATFENFEELIEDLRKLSKCRNALCHGSWRPPDENGISVPLFVDRGTKTVFDTSIDCQVLNQIQKVVANLSCFVVSTVTSMGWQFPGSLGPGKPIWD